MAQIWVNHIKRDSLILITFSSQNYNISHFPQIVIKLWSLCDLRIYVTFPSQFYHFVTKAFLEISTKLLHKFPFYGWSQSDEKVMEMWQVQISTHFLALHIWKFPPWKNSFIFEGKILMWEIDGFVNAAIHVFGSINAFYRW